VLYKALDDVLDEVIDLFNSDHIVHLIINDCVHLLNGNNNFLDIMSGDLRFGDGATFGYIEIKQIFSIVLLKNQSKCIEWEEFIIKER